MYKTFKGQLQFELFSTGVLRQMRRVEMLLGLSSGLLLRPEADLRQQLPREVRRNRIRRVSRSPQLHRARKVAAASEFRTSFKTSKRWRG